MPPAFELRAVNWDMTYACPLRCVHCYSESGRRPSRQLRTDEMLLVADSLVSLGPSSVQLSGGEPLLVGDLFRVAERITSAGIPVSLFTSGWLPRKEDLTEFPRVFSRVHVSLDGATAGTHDRIRGRRGSFERAVRTLEALGSTALKGLDGNFSVGIDCTVVRSNLGEIEDVCTTVAPALPSVDFIEFGAAAPAGLASRRSFEESELLTDEQVRDLTAPGFERRLRELAPRGVSVSVSDVRDLQMRPDMVSRGEAMTGLMQVEPDGQVRGMAMYEGTVGSLLEEPAEELWERACARPGDPFVVEQLSGVRTMRQWARAVRRIDHHFGSAAVRRRIESRTELPGPSAPVDL